MKLRNGRPASGMTGFGSVSVSGRRRVPSPPASTSACTATGLPADALVRETLLLEEGTVEEVAPVDDERLAHPVLDRGPVELAELGPLRDEDGGVGIRESVVGRVAHLRAAQQVPGAIGGDRVVDAHVRALGLEPPGEHEARGLADVVGVRLERDAEQRDLLADERAEVLLELAYGAPPLELVDLDDRGE